MYFSLKDLIIYDPIKSPNQLNLFYNIHYSQQLHSDKVIQVDNTLNLKSKVANSLIKKKQFQSLWIYTKDCISIFILDIKTKISQHVILG